MTNYAQHVNRKETPQTEQAHPDQVENSAGGYSFKVDCWKRLERFLILGCDGGTYYATEKVLTKQNAACVEECARLDSKRTVETIATISENGRAPKNDPAVFALALCAAYEGPGQDEVRKLALAAVPRVCRIGTHLFHFAAAVNNLRGWGRGLRSAVGNWYTSKTPDDLAYQLVKYQQRDGWSHRDLLRLCHVASSSMEANAALRWATSSELGDRHVGKDKQRGYAAVPDDALPRIIQAYELMKAATSVQVVTGLIREYRMTHEMVPTRWQSEPEVWEALLDHMPLTALLRNLGRMTSMGLLKPLADKNVPRQLADPLALKKAKVHPMSVLVALETYRAGHGVKGKLSWSPVTSIVDALDEAFYMAFDAVEPTRKAHMLAIDVSGSMDGGAIAGLPGITPRVAAACMAMVTARTEPRWAAMAFTAPGGWRSLGGGFWAGGGYGGMHGGGDPGFTELDISPRMRLDTVVQKMRALPMGGTDCSLPMRKALKDKVEVDVFVISTDNETWAGTMHPHQALEQYRKGMNRPQAKLVVAAFTATEFSIANPNDAGMLDVVGCSTSTPAVIADFVRG